MSGSCNVKTCWRGLPNKFLEVGIKLLRLYNKKSVNVQIAQVIRSGLPRHVDDSLVYISESSDYCNYNPKMGSFGTVGRYKMQQMFYFPSSNVFTYDLFVFIENVTRRRLEPTIVLPCAAVAVTLHKLLNRRNVVNANTIGAAMLIVKIVLA